MTSNRHRFQCHVPWINLSFSTPEAAIDPQKRDLHQFVAQFIYSVIVNKDKCKIVMVVV